MKLIRRLIRLTRLALHLVTGVLLIVSMRYVMRWPIQDKRYRRGVSWWLRHIVGIVGGRMQVQGQPAPQNTLLVANHVSWLDIPLLGGLANVYFLSKQEVRAWPIIGWLAAKAGTLFIQRGARDAARQANALIAERLQAEGNVLIFPEGTTTEGLDMKRFHARLFAGATEAQAAVQAIAVQYLDTTGQVSRQVPYVKQQNLMENLWNVLAEPYVTIEVNFLPVLQVSDFSSRKALASYSEQQIRQVLQPRWPAAMETTTTTQTQAAS